MTLSVEGPSVIWSFIILNNLQKIKTAVSKDSGGFTGKFQGNCNL